MKRKTASSSSRDKATTDRADRGRSEARKTESREKLKGLIEQRKKGRRISRKRLSKWWRGRQRGRHGDRLKEEEKDEEEEAEEGE